MGAMTRVSRLRQGKRRAISPIIATVLVIAVTMIASVAVGGFVFGIFAQGQNSAQVAVTGTALSAVSFLSTNAGKTFTCATTSSAAFLTLTNTGSGSASVATISFTWAGGNSAFTLLSGTCNIGASGSTAATTYIIFPATTKITPSAIPGQTYTGTVTLSNGAQLLLTGIWQ
jgi:flagellin-like protein